MTNHASVLEIDLDAIAENWRTLKDRHLPGRTSAVVKANGYGLGAIPIAQRLAQEGCRHFFVAHLQEALALRAALPNEIMIAALNGLWHKDAPEYVHHHITPVLGSMEELETWSAQARQQERSLPAIVHVDTGMHRLGLEHHDVAALAADPTRLSGIMIRFIMTHLVSAEMPDDPVNNAQRHRFRAACAGLPAAPLSLAASSGMFLGPDYQSDLARPGAALYGINPTPGQPNPMRPVVRLKARVLQVREIGAGERVGYNGIWRATRPSRIATVSVGYADGYFRRLSNCAQAHFDAHPLPLVGRVSMDLATFDVSDHTGIVPGSWLELMGPMQTPDQIAARSGTNGYEVLTSLGHRYARHYLPQ